MTEPAKPAKPADNPVRFIWARNRTAAGVRSDPMPQIIYEDVGVSHLEIVASHVIWPGHVPDIDMLVTMFPAPKIAS